jgi:hypothetical protein
VAEVAQPLEVDAAGQASSTLEVLVVALVARQVVAEAAALVALAAEALEVAALVAVGNFNFSKFEVK